MNKPQFHLNLPTKRRVVTQKCNLCQKDYETQHKQQRYCNKPCKPLTAVQKRAGITDAVRRGEAVAIPDKTYGKFKRVKPTSKKCDNESLGELSRKFLSMRL